MKRTELGSFLLTATDGLLRTTTDGLLLLLYYQAALVGKTGSPGIWRAAREANQALDELNYDSIKRALNKLTSTKTIKRTKREIEITELGKKRIESLLPQYLSVRPWDGHMYLISYDIPTTADTKRAKLRMYIQKTGGALLQESLWINPYNPSLLLENFQQAHDIPGTILVSKLGHDGTIGTETLESLLIRIYHLHELATRYDEFITHYRTIPAPPLLQCAADYFSILKDDPQLPFELLAPDFPSQTAHKLFLMKTSRT